MPRHPLALVAATGLGVTAACGDDGGSTFGEPTTEPPSIENNTPTEPPEWEILPEATAEPLAYGSEPLWRSDTTSVSTLQDAYLLDDTAILYGLTDSRQPQLTVVDADSGRERWGLGSLDDLSGGDGAAWWGSMGDTMAGQPDELVVTEHRGEPVVLVTYICDRCDDTQVNLTTELGVAALSVETGEVVWRTASALSPPEAGAGPHQRGVVGDPGTVVATVEPDGLDYDPRTKPYTDALGVVAIDATDGSLLWEESGLLPTTVVGDTVLTQAATDGPVVDQTLPAETTVALDAATGTRLWDVSERYPQSQVTLATEDLALLQVPSTEEDGQPTGSLAWLPETVVVETETGEEIASFGTTVAVNPQCTHDDEMIACVVDDEEGHKLATLPVATREGGVSEQVLPDKFLSGANNGGFFIEGTPSAEAHTQVDRAGRVLHADLPGRFRTASDDYVIFEQHRGAGLDRPYTVHQVTG